MGLDVNEMFECTSKKNNTCSVLGCIFYVQHKKEFIICPSFKLKKEYAVYKK